MMNKGIITANRALNQYVPVCIAITAFVLYLATFSVRLDRNSVYELVGIESGQLTRMFLPRHMLFQPVGAAFYGLWQLTGYTGNSLQPTRIIVVLCAAINLALLFKILLRVSGNQRVAIWLTIAYGVSYAYWYWSTNVHYIQLAVTAALIAILLACNAAENGFSYLRLAGIGLATLLAVSFWQANVFLVVPLFYAIYSHSTGRRKKRLHVALLWTLGTCLAIGSLYILVALWIGSIDSPRTFWAWATTYPGRKTIFGVFEVTRLRNAVPTALAAIVPLWQGLGLRALLAGHLSLDKALPQSSLITTAIMALSTTVWLVHSRHSFAPPERRYLVFGFMLVGSYLLFILWWDPFEPRWWLMPMIGVWLILAVVFSRAGSRSPRKPSLLLIVWAISLLLANFQSTVYPRRFEADPAIARVETALQHIDSHDLVIDLFWEDWTLYLEYLHHYDVFSLPDQAAHLESHKALEQMRNAIQRKISMGHQVFIPDWSSYPDSRWQWPLGLLGIAKNDFDGLVTEYAWGIGEEIVWRVIGFRDTDVR